MVQSLTFIKVYGKNLLFATQHASPLFLVTIPGVPPGCSQPFALGGIEPTLAPGWIFLS